MEEGKNGNQLAHAGFQGREEKLAIADQSSIQSSARFEAMIKAAVFNATTRPRDELKAHLRIMKTCERPGFAEDALYSFPRGGQKVEGPSAPMAREIARIWGNIQHELQIISITDDAVHIRGYAVDWETNVSAAAEDQFARLVQRKDKQSGKTEWVRPDERDLRELINRRGAILVRNAILQILPSDIVEEAKREVKKTNVKAAKGEIEQNREDATRRLVRAFDRLNVTIEMLEGYIEHPIAEITAEDLTDLRAVFKSIDDGNSRREEHFGSTAAAGASAADLTDKLRGSKKAAETPNMQEGKTEIKTEPAKTAGDGNPPDGAGAASGVSPNLTDLGRFADTLLLHAPQGTTKQDVQKFLKTWAKGHGAGDPKDTTPDQRRVLLTAAEQKQVNYKLATVGK